jgi:hypothetical protein
MPTRSSDSEIQTFRFPYKGHVYDVRARRYLGFIDKVTVAVPHAEAMVWAVLPRRIGNFHVAAPLEIKTGTDLSADITLKGAVGKGVFHVEMISPTGKSGFHMKRNIDSIDGKAKFVFRIAENDPQGSWKISVTDALTGEKVTQTVLVISR